MVLDRTIARTLFLAAIVLRGRPARGDDVLVPGTLTVDPATLTTIGIQLTVTGDDNHDAQVAVRYRSQVDDLWQDAMPLFRALPSPTTVSPDQFAGTIFDLAPGTTYDVELHVTDADGPVDQTLPLVAATRPVPAAAPRHPIPVAVATTADLQRALARAVPGDVITLADGIYSGPLQLEASGTAEEPIVVRGTTTAGTILDGSAGCSSCKALLEIAGSFVHLERLTIRNTDTAIWFRTAGTEANVVRRVLIDHVRFGINGQSGQRGFYICDNVLTGLLPWTTVYTDDGGIHANDDGIVVHGTGHVVCHNDLLGFGDALKNGGTAARAIDFYGNEVRSAYDDGIELDRSEGNVRAFRNRFTNPWNAMSFQPVAPGPVYAFRNVVVNVLKEQLKFHDEPSGVLVLHNTFVSQMFALGMFAPTASANFVVANNVFVGPDPPGARVVDWEGTIVGGTFDWNGWIPNGRFHFGAAPDWRTFRAMMRAGVFESHGVLLAPDTFATGLVAPVDSKVRLDPQDVTLASDSAAIDSALPLPNLNDRFADAGPDRGALEDGCPVPIFGPRPEGIDETNEPTGCAPTLPPPTTTSTTSSTMPPTTVPATTTTSTVPPTTLPATTSTSTVPTTSTVATTSTSAVPTTTAPATTSTTAVAITVPLATSTTSTTLPWVLIRTNAFVLRDHTVPADKPARRAIRFISSSKADPGVNRIVPPQPGTSGDPRLHGGAIVVYNAAGGSEAVVVPLRRNGWSLLGGATHPRGYVYRAPASRAPISLVLLKRDHLVVRGSGAAWPYALRAPSQGRVGLRCTLGFGGRWCAAGSADVAGASTAKRRADRVGLFEAAPDTSPPASCPPLGAERTAG